MHCGRQRERIWCRWQGRSDLFDPSNVQSYSAQHATTTVWRHSLNWCWNLIAVVTGSTVGPLGGHLVTGSAIMNALRPLGRLVLIVTWEVSLSEGLSSSGWPEHTCGVIMSHMNWGGQSESVGHCSPALDCGGAEKTDGTTSMHALSSLCSCSCGVTLCLKPLHRDIPEVRDRNLEWWVQINPFFPGCLIVRVFIAAVYFSSLSLGYWSLPCWGRRGKRSSKVHSVRRQKRNT